MLATRCRLLRRLLRRRIDGWAATRRNVVLVQIGSHDGVSNDPFSDHLDAHADWQAVLVEPIPLHFESLKRRRPDGRFTLVQAAITDHDGQVDMTMVTRKAGMPEWVDQINSIDPEHVLKHATTVDGLKDAMTSVKVAALTFDSLLDSCGVEAFDALHIDTEGHDAVILASVDFARFKPALVMYEHRHLSQSARIASNRILTDAGYRLHRSCMDTLALRREAERISGRVFKRGSK